MGMKSRAIGIASIGIILAFASSASAQPAGSYGAGSAPGKAESSAGSLGAGSAGATPGGATGNLGSSGSTSYSTNWNTSTVSTTNPFGTIDINAAGTTPDSIRQWAQGRSATERAELQGRCGVISANAGRYPMQAQTFCRNFMTASNASPGGTPGSTTTR